MGHDATTVVNHSWSKVLHSGGQQKKETERGMVISGGSTGMREKEKTVGDWDCRCGKWPNDLSLVLLATWVEVCVCVSRRERWERFNKALHMGSDVMMTTMMMPKLNLQPADVALTSPTPPLHPLDVFTISVLSLIANQGLRTQTEIHL